LSCAENALERTGSPAIALANTDHAAPSLSSICKARTVCYHTHGEII